jgi:glycerol uptake facilitator-like aquaporin
LAIGFSLLAAIFTIGPVSGAGLNPAVCGGYAIVQAILGAHPSDYDHNAKYIWIYILGPYLGAFLAVVNYYLLHRSEIRRDKYDELGLCSIKLNNKKYFTMKILFL